MKVVLVTERTSVELLRVCGRGSFTGVTVQPARADLNRPHCDRAAGFKSDDGESEGPFTMRLQTFSVQCENSKSC